MIFAKAEAEEIKKRLPCMFGRAIQQRNIQHAFGGKGNARHRFQKFHASRNVAERKFVRVELLQKFQNAWSRFSVQSRRRRFTDGMNARRIRQFNNHGLMRSGTCAAYAAGDFPRIGEPQLDLAGVEFHDDIEDQASPICNPIDLVTTRWMQIVFHPQLVFLAGRESSGALAD